MIRILIFILWAVLITFAVTVLMTFDSRISGEAFGVKFDSPSWLLMGGLTVSFLMTIYATHKIKDIMALPAKLRARDAKAKRDRGVAALTRGLEAVAVGDAADAAHHAKVARKHLDEVALTRLLSAQAAQLSGDETMARESFSAMLEAPETEFLGLKGLYAQAIANGDHDTARKHAERAFRLRSNAGWAFQSVVDLSLERGAWGDARDAIAQGKRNKLIDADKADRASAALLTAAAYAAAATGDASTAIEEAESALKLAQGFTPAAALAASHYADAGRKGKAASIIETAFSDHAHPALLRLYDHLYADADPMKHGEKLRKLAAKNPDTREAKMLRARASILEGDHKAASDLLEPMLAENADAPVLRLMADAMSGMHGEEVGRGWLERAAAAPRDPRPGADGRFHFTRAGWARLVREYAEHGRLAPPPLEDADGGISEEELKLLTAPPPKPTAPEADAETGERPADAEAGRAQSPAPAEAASGNTASGDDGAKADAADGENGPSKADTEARPAKPAEAPEPESPKIDGPANDEKARSA
ncbi:MAG: heme biosynthesis HemY N-terminal domain-containing protein [Pseudomonadota bacterium]